MSDNPQELLWTVPNALGNWWWFACSVLSLGAAGLCFLYLIMNERFSPVTISRVMMTGGFIAIGLTPLNSGWMPWGVLLLSAGGCYTYFLIATRWCQRHDKWAIMRGWIARIGGHHAEHRPRSEASD